MSLAKFIKTFHTAPLRAISWYRIFLLWQPFTFRGLMGLTLSIVSLKIIGIPQNDLVAHILGGGLLGLIVVTTAATVYVGSRIKQKLTAVCNFEGTSLLAKTKITSSITLNNSSLPPFFSLQIRRHFAHQDTTSRIESYVHEFTGRDKCATRYSIDSTTFPHRGLWEIQYLNCKIEDALGFSRFKWQIRMAQTVEIAPQPLAIKSLPIVASSSSSGDQISFTNERTGDLFDIKQYDPSDGISRILWKTFARSGELVVRRPEPAIIPEGEVAIYLIANKIEDHVAGAAWHYISNLHSKNITVLFGTDAMTEQLSPTGALLTDTNSSFAIEPKKISQAINRCVWSKKIGTGTDFEEYLEELNNNARCIRQVIVFSAENNIGWLNSLQAIANAHHIKITIAVVPDSLAGIKNQNTLKERSIQPREIKLNYHGFKVQFNNFWTQYIRKLIFRKTNMPNTNNSLLTLPINHHTTDIIICEHYEHLGS